VPDTRSITLATHRFVTELALAGARVIHHSAAERAEAAAVPLRFSAMHGDGDPSTLVVPDGSGASELFSVVYAPGYHGVSSLPGDPAEIATVTIVERGEDGSDRPALARLAARRSGADFLRVVERNEAVAFIVPASAAPAFARAIHAAALTALDGESRLVASSGHA
jgi:aspartokinase